MGPRPSHFSASLTWFSRLLVCLTVAIPENLLLAYTPLLHRSIFLPTLSFLPEHFYMWGLYLMKEGLLHSKFKRNPFLSLVPWRFFFFSLFFEATREPAYPFPQPLPRSVPLRRPLNFFFPPMTCPSPLALAGSFWDLTRPFIVLAMPDFLMLFVWTGGGPEFFPPRSGSFLHLCLSLGPSVFLFMVLIYFFYFLFFFYLLAGAFFF